MIRRTVARAFGSPGEERPSLEKSVSPGPRASRIQVVNALFTEIHEAIEKAAAERPPAGPGVPAVKVAKPRPRPEGIEFTVESSAGCYRFLNAMDGIAWIFREEEGRRADGRLLSVLFEGGRPRLIQKPAGDGRAPFRYTSVRELAAEFVPGRPPAQVPPRSAAR